jgi:hypothetical protein
MRVYRGHPNHHLKLLRRRSPTRPWLHQPPKPAPIISTGEPINAPNGSGDGRTLEATVLTLYMEVRHLAASASAGASSSSLPPRHLRESSSTRLQSTCKQTTEGEKNLEEPDPTRGRGGGGTAPPGGSRVEGRLLGALRRG